MRKLVVYFVFILLCSLSLSSYSQKRTGSNLFIAPVFIDSGRLVKDIVTSTNLKDILKYQSNEGIPESYTYDFKIDPNGKVISGVLYPDSIYLSVNKFIKDIFNRYKWQPARKLGCSKCRVTGYGIFTISFITIENNAKLEIIIFNGKIGERMRKKVVYSNTIKL